MVVDSLLHCTVGGGCPATQHLSIALSPLVT